MKQWPYQVIGSIGCVLLETISIKAQQIEVAAGDYPRYQSLIEVALPKPLGNTAYEVKNIKSGKKAPAEIRAGNLMVFILPDSLKAGETALYDLIKADNKIEAPVAVAKKDSGLLVSVNSRPVFFYHTVPYLRPVDSPAYYTRSGFIHPLYSPEGKILTDDFPVGHMHQHGIMIAWVNTLFKNTAVDFWNQHLQTGNVKHVAVEAIHSGTVTATLQLRLQHYSTALGAILDEKWTITIYPFSEYFLFDLQSRQVNTTNDTLFLNQYHYGGMAFRGSREWNPDDSLQYKNAWQIQTDASYSLSNANGTHARYVTASGLVDGKMGSVTVFGFPSNFRYPQAIRVHPTMPYWCYAPEVDGPFAIAPRSAYHSGFRYFVSDAPNPTQSDQLLHDLLHPVSVKVLE